MFINESVNVNDSAVFYGFMREALIEQVGNDKEVVAMLESASDADIMSYAVLGKAIPSDVDAGLLETVLHGVLKDVVLENTDIFSDGYTASQFIHEIGPLSDISSKDIFCEQLEGLGKEVKNAMDARPKWEVIKDSLVKIKDTIAKSSGDAFAAVSKFVTDHKGSIGAAALIALASFAAYKTYQNFFSKAAKACAGKSGDAKKACMAQAKAKAQTARINALNKGVALGSKSSNPAKVKSALKAKIAKMKK